MTHRQFDAWCWWRILDMNRPSRSDAYAMQTALEAHRVLMKDPNKVQMKHMILKFPTPGDSRTVPTAGDRRRQLEQQLLNKVNVLKRNKGMPKELIEQIIRDGKRRIEEELNGHPDRT